jgi:hypothetical protein
MSYCPDCGAEVEVADTFCSECGNKVEELGSSNDTVGSEGSSGDSISSEKMTFTERVEEIQEKRDNSSSEVAETPDPTDGDEADEGITWTLSLVVGLFMTLSSLVLALYYVFAQTNLASGILFWLAGTVGGRYLWDGWNISRWLAVALFLMLWMAGSFFIGTGAA